MNRSKPKKEKSVLRVWVNSLASKQPKKQSRKQRGEITPEIYAEMITRDGYRCAQCGAQEGEQAEFKGVPYTKRLEGHHITYRSDSGTGELRNVVTACGPVTQSGTCHHRAHATRAGRVWFEDWREACLDAEGRIKAIWPIVNRNASAVMN